MLSAHGEVVKVGSRALDLLFALASRPGETISHDNLVAQVWPETFVDPGNLRVHVGALRKVLAAVDPTIEYIANVPGRGYCFVAAANTVTASVEPSNTSAAGHFAIPALNLIGRSEILNALLQQLQRQRIVSLVGAGGIGKTTLAIAMMARAADDFPDGFALIDVGTIADPAHLLPAVAAGARCVIGSLRPLEELAEKLAGRSMLIVLDCCEHLIDDVARLADALAVAQSVKLLVTSREPLRVMNEWVCRVPPLDIPTENEALTASTALEYEAIQLFVDRVAQAQGGYELSDIDAPLVGEICRRLDGLGLAIELAAGRISLLGIRGLRDSLRESFDTLTGGRRTALPRHQTLKAAIDWSYNLLTAEQRTVLNRLSVFSAGFSLPAARAVASPGAAIGIETCLADLVAKSLIVADLSLEPVRYRLLDMTRAYAAAALRSSGEEQSAASRHAAHFLTVFEQAAEQWQTREPSNWVSHYQRELGNLRAALDWAYSPAGNKELAVALTIAAIPFWQQLSLVDECLARVLQALDIIDQDTQPSQTMQLLGALGFPHMRPVPDRPSGAVAWSRALSIARAIDDVDFQLRGLWAMWVDRVNAGEPRPSLERAEEFHELSLRSTDQADRLIGLRMRARSQHLLGEHAAAEQHIRLMLEAYEPIFGRAHMARFQYDQLVTARITLARLLWLRGSEDQALAEVDDMIVAAKASGHNLTLCHALADAACPLSLLAGDRDRAERYLAMLKDGTREHALDVWHTYAECYQAHPLLGGGQDGENLRCAVSGLDRLAASGFQLYRTFFQFVIASALMASSRHSDAIAMLEDAEQRCARTGEAWLLPELMRLRARALIDMGRSDLNVEALVAESSALARQQGAVAWEQRSGQLLRDVTRALHTA
ncbi:MULTISPECIES: winged helix-turn-helix domain-containing protein [unclassified Bosea (in: a-proteobacteria)]|nr:MULTISPECIES: winged helix-turn-helix domain-containing protein [unclassified Bosea (in: a-proteobacteria)]